MSDNHWGETRDEKLESELNKAASKGKEWKLIEKMVNGLFVEQRRARRWGIFFKTLTFLYLFALLVIFWTKPSFEVEDSHESEAHTAVIDVKGAIADDQDANADTLVHLLRKAFENEQAKAVVLRINSPGGSPVQAGYVYDEIKRLRGLYPEKPVYAVIMDIGASGAYYIAAAADEIYADKASLVGSIGVISSSFGFVDLMDKLGVERRALTAGENKAFLDPFQPLRDSDKAFWQSVLNTTHQQSIDQVKKGRGDRLSDDPELFSGLVWTGEQAVQKGLVDGLGSTGSVARDVIGVENTVLYTPKASPLDELVDRLGVSFAKTISTSLGLGQSPIQY